VLTRVISQLAHTRRPANECKSVRVNWHADKLKAPVLAKPAPKSQNRV
jgi:hypothetical protein